MDSDTSCWWESEKGDGGQAVKDTLDGIMQNQDGLRAANLTHMRMYRNMAVAGLGPHAYNRLSRAFSDSPLAFNVVRNMIDAATAKITKSRPNPWFQTYGATPEDQYKAKLLEKWVRGVFYENEVYRHGPRVFTDCGIFGTGFFKTCDTARGIKIERAFPGEVVVDHVEGMYGDPRNEYQRKFLDRGRLARMFPKFAAEIMDLEPPGADDEEEIAALYSERRTNMVRLEEAYHFASEPGADDGLMIQCAGGLELARTKWPHWSPFSRLYWAESPLGYYGMGLAESLKGVQAEINRLLRSIQDGMKLLGNPYVMIDRGSNVQKTTITDVPGSILLYSGKEPKVQAFATTHPEVFAHLDRLYQRSYEIARISQMTAHSSVPTQFESGRAQVVADELQNDNFSVVIRGYENLFMDAAKKALRVAAKKRGYRVKIWGEEGLEEIDFARDIDLAEDEYLMRIYSTSLLGETPAGQIDNFERLVRTGVVQNPDDVLEQMDHPDIISVTRRRLAPRKIVERMVSIMLRGGPQQAPEPQMNLALCMDTAQMMYHEAKLGFMKPDGSVPPEYEARLEMVRKFMVSTQAMMPPPMPAAAPAGAPPV